MVQPALQFLPPRPEKAPIYIEDVRLTREQKDFLVSMGICTTVDTWDPVSKKCHCYRCNRDWYARGALSAPITCNGCSQRDWNQYVLFYCRWCRGVFASASGCDPYTQYPECPDCEKREWLPKLRPQSTWRDWTLSVFGSLGVGLGVAAIVNLLWSGISAGEHSIPALFALNCTSLAIPLATLGIPAYLLYSALIGKYARNWLPFLLFGVLCLAAPLGWGILRR